MGETTVNEVKVKSAWLSKINWTQVVALLIGVASFLGYKISDGDQQTILGAIMSVSAALTIIWRTFFNNTVTKAPE